MKLVKEPGVLGWLAYLEAYVIYVEFLGYGYHDPSDDEHWNSRPTRYYRALLNEPLKTPYYETIRNGNILEEYGEEDECFVLHKLEADTAVRRSKEYWIKRKEKELEEMRERCG